MSACLMAGWLDGGWRTDLVRRVVVLAATIDSNSTPRALHASAERIHAVHAAF
ncbi:MAG: hypothetical protein AB8G96_12940 [Phycisphaerales bacterium]